MRTYQLPNKLKVENLWLANADCMKIKESISINHIIIGCNELIKKLMNKTLCFIQEWIWSITKCANDSISSTDSNGFMHNQNHSKKNETANHKGIWYSNGSLNQGQKSGSTSQQNTQ